MRPTTSRSGVSTAPSCLVGIVDTLKILLLKYCAVSSSCRAPSIFGNDMSPMWKDHIFSCSSPTKSSLCDRSLRSTRVTGNRKKLPSCATPETPRFRISHFVGSNTASNAEAIVCSKRCFSCSIKFQEKAPFLRHPRGSTLQQLIL